MDRLEFEMPILERQEFEGTPGLETRKIREEGEEKEKKDKKGGNRAGQFPEQCH